MLLSELHAEIKKLAPIVSITGDGGITFDAAATDEQRQAAQDYMSAHLSELNETPSVKMISKLTIVDRMIAAGKIEAAMAALSSEPVAKFRWDAAQEIASNDPQVRALLSAIGANPDEILA